MLLASSLLNHAVAVWMDRLTDSRARRRAVTLGVAANLLVLGVPVAGQDVVINGGASLTNATPALASLTVNSAKTLTFNGWDTILNAEAVTIAGMITHEINTDTVATDGWTPNARVNIDCINLTVSTGGKIDASLKGYRGGANPTRRGYGPGGGAGFVGGGYGGMSSGASAVNGGLTYGLANAPTDPGSGGGEGGNQAGGAGGGAIRVIAANSVTVDGKIFADGANVNGGGGSGGAVLIECSTILGNGGVISAIGGKASRGGGGGRIAVLYSPTAQRLIPLPSVKFTTAGGDTTGTTTPDYVGGVGTLYFPDSQFLFRQTGAISHAGQWLAPDMGSSWEPDSLALNNAWLRFPTEGFKLKVTNGISFVGTSVNINKLELTNGIVSCGGGILLSQSSIRMENGTVDCGGSCNSMQDYGGGVTTPPPRRTATSLLLPRRRRRSSLPNRDPGSECHCRQRRS